MPKLYHNCRVQISTVDKKVYLIMSIMDIFLSTKKYRIGRFHEVNVKNFGFLGR